MYPNYMALLMLLLYLSPVCAQDSSLIKDNQRLDSVIQHLPTKYLDQTAGKARRMQQRVDQYSLKTLNRLQKQETGMRAKLAKIDSVAANNIFNHSIDSLGALNAKFKGKVSGLALSGSGTGYLDTLQNSLSFLNNAKSIAGQSKALQDKLSGSLKNVQDLQARFQQADQIKAYIRSRRQQLKEQLAQYTGFADDLKKYNKETYYYGQQLREYKELLKDKKKAETKALELLKRLPAYNDFLSKHSQLAGLFNLSAGGNDVAQSLAGLQTRSQVEQLIQQRLGGSGPDARAAVSQQMSQAREQFDELKKKFPDLDNAADMPNFKPNEMKTKSFLQRLEFGGNMQFARSTQFYPTTSDIAGQVAYKFHKNGTAGMGAAYKLGMGTGFDNIRFSHQGVGLRSFLDWKLKGSIFVNGGFEENYIASFQNSAQLYNIDNWQGSALVGISKKYKINSKLKGNIILLYDFLYNQHIPRTDPVKLRLGYNF
ncbi:hypothetical protein [Chitinophaga sp. GbtcB8]|uniref:hypothetical protein n=1 Tax=Chitinophaga sp. GbtcB8 TaxID=2824753 RepID=UPI001C30AA51|nr:hypothetical protein [Chitinophaga sp. GbtcB8]